MYKEEGMFWMSPMIDSVQPSVKQSCEQNLPSSPLDTHCHDEVLVRLSSLFVSFDHLGEVEVGDQWGMYQDKWILGIQDLCGSHYM